MQKRIIISLIGFAVLNNFYTNVSAQDAHYWTLQYGPKSSLLGGAVIGSVNDVSATFYNPGALSLAEDLAFAVSADVFEFSRITLQDGGGEGVDLGTSRSGLRPSLIAGTLKRDLFGKGVLAYSALTRARGSQDLQGILQLSSADLPVGSELDDFSALVRFEGEYSDIWGGLTYAQPFGSHIGIGVSWYVAARSQRRRRETLDQEIRTDGLGTSRTDIRGGNYTTIRTLFKFGAYASTGPITAGIALTSPSIHISGSGELGFYSGFFSPDTSTMAANVQNELSAEYKTPLSVGVGFSWRFGAGRFQTSIEWYDKIAPYFVMEGENFQAQEPEEVILPVDAVHALDDVFNWAVGFEYAISKRINGYFSYFTDNSGFTDNIKRADLSTLPLDIRNLSLGADVLLGPVLITIGAGFSWGSKLDEQLTNLLRQEQQDFQAKFVYRSTRILFGFEVGR